MYNYAELNEDNVCIGVKSVSGPINLPNHIRIPEISDDYLGRKYENGAWLEKPEVVFVEEVTLNEKMFAEIQYQTCLLEMGIMGGE